MKEIAQEKNVVCLDYSNDDRFLGQYSLFYDPYHLNDKAAHSYSEIVAETIDSLYTVNILKKE